MFWRTRRAGLLLVSLAEQVHNAFQFVQRSLI